MKAVLCEKYGSLEHLHINEITVPVINDTEVLIQVKACAIDFAQMLMIMGKYQVKPTLPFCPGNESAGIVIKIGKKVKNINIGDRVIAMTHQGSLAEQVKVEAWQCYKIPKNISFETAAGILYAYGTAYHGLIDIAKIKQSETVAILGASGGVGLAAIDIAKHQNANVIAVASSEKKLSICKQQGADIGLNYSKEDLKSRLKELTQKKGVNIIFDNVGGDASEQALRACARLGRFLTVGFASGTIPKIPLNLVLLKECSIHGIFWSGTFLLNDPLTFQKNNEKIIKNVSLGLYKPKIYNVLPLSDIKEAFNMIKNRQAIGKIILKP